VRRELKLEPCHPGCFPGQDQTSDPWRNSGNRNHFERETRFSPLTRKGNRARQGTLGIGERGVAVEVETDSGRLTRPASKPLCLSGGTLQGCRRLDAGRGIVCAGRTARATDEDRAIERPKQLAQVFNLVLEDQEYFIAGDFLVRSKPPLTGESNRAGFAGTGRKSKLDLLLSLRQDTEPIQGLDRFGPVPREVSCCRETRNEFGYGKRYENKHLTAREKETPKGASDEFPDFDLRRPNRNFGLTLDTNRSMFSCVPPCRYFRVVGTNTGRTINPSACPITEKARSEIPRSSLVGRSLEAVRPPDHAALRVDLNVDATVGLNGIWWTSYLPLSNLTSSRRPYW